MTDRNDEGHPTESEVGYGKPPRHTRFKPGRSGNPKGRPQGARGRAKILEAIADETHLVTENGFRQRRSTLALVLLSLRNRSFTGNVKAFRAVHELLQRYGPQEAQQAGGFLVVPERLSPEEWEREALKVLEYQEQLRAEMERKGLL